MNTVKKNLALALGAVLMAATPVAISAPANATTTFKTPCAKVTWSSDYHLMTGETATVEVEVKERCDGAKVTLVQDGARMLKVPVSHKDGFVYSTTGLVEGSVNYRIKVVAKNGERVDSWSTYDWAEPKVG